MDIRKIFAYVAALLFYNIAEAQNPKFIQPEKTLYEIEAELDPYFENLRLEIGDEAFFDEGGEYARYKEFTEFWEPRLFPHGDFVKYKQAEAAHYGSSGGGSAPDGSLGGPTLLSNGDPWHEVGPVVSPVNQSTAFIGPIEFMTFFETNHSFMLCGALKGGLFYTTNGGITWQNGGSDVGTGTTWATSGCGSAVYDPADHQTWYASSAGQGHGTSSFIFFTGGIFRTFDEGQTWSQIADHTNLGGIWNQIFKLVVDPTDGATLYAATSDGIFKTTNGLDPVPIWTKLTINIPNPIISDPNYGTAVYDYSSAQRFTFDLEFMPFNNQILFASVKFIGRNPSDPDDFVDYWQHIYSTNAGATWTELPNQPALLSTFYQIDPSNNPTHWANLASLTLETSRADANIVYCNLVRSFSSSSNALWLHDYAATTWQNVPISLLQDFGGGNSFGVSQFNPDEVFIGHSIGARRIDVSAITSTSLGSFHADVEDIICHPLIPNEVWVANHGGVVQSLNNGASFQDMSTTLGVAEVLRMATAYSDPKYVLIGTYHDGTSITQGAYATGWNPPWKHVNGGDGLQPLIDNVNPQYMYASSQAGGWVGSNNFGSSFSVTLPTFSSDWHSAAVLNKTDPDIMYRIGRISSQDHVIRSFTNGLSPTDDITDFQTIYSVANGYINYIIWKVFTPHYNGDYLFAHVISDKGKPTEKHHLWKTDKAMDPVTSNVVSSWVELPIPRNAWFADIDFSPEDADTVFIGYGSSNFSASTTGTQMLYKMDYSSPSILTQYTCPSGTCDDLTDNLPNTGIGNDGIEIETGSNQGIYVATDFGVYFTNRELLANGTGWQQFGTELPHVIGNSLQINYQINRLRIGTFGRGVWEHDLYCSSIYDKVESGVYTADTYLEVEHDITSTAIVPPTKKVNYRAGNKIYLQSGFHAQPGSYFHAFIHPCNHSGNSFRNTVLNDFETSDEEMKEKKDDDGMLIRPNPNAGVFTIDFKSPTENESVRIEIIDITGRVVFNQKIENGSSHADLNLSELPSGLYFVKMERPGTYSVEKLLIEK